MFPRRNGNTRSTRGTRNDGADSLVLLVPLVFHFLRVAFIRHRASGSGRSWIRTAFGRFATPPSRWKFVLLPYVDQSSLPFHPALGLSMRPSTFLAKKPIG